MWVWEMSQPEDFFPSILLLFVVFQDRVSMYNSPKFHSVDKADLELRESTCLYLPSAVIKAVCHHCLAYFYDF